MQSLHFLHPTGAAVDLSIVLTVWSSWGSCTTSFMSLSTDVQILPIKANCGTRMRLDFGDNTDWPVCCRHSQPHKEKGLILLHTYTDTIYSCFTCHWSMIAVFLAVLIVPDNHVRQHNKWNRMSATTIIPNIYSFRIVIPGYRLADPVAADDPATQAGRPLGLVALILLLISDIQN